VGGPFEDDCPPKEPKTLAGLEEACELSCEKLRADDVAKAVARGDDLDIASGRVFLSKLEPVEAISRVRDAMLGCVFGASGDDEDASSKKFHLVHRCRELQSSDHTFSTSASNQCISLNLNQNSVGRSKVEDAQSHSRAIDARLFTIWIASSIVISNAKIGKSMAYRMAYRMASPWAIAANLVTEKHEKI